MAKAAEAVTALTLLRRKRNIQVVQVTNTPEDKETQSSAINGSSFETPSLPYLPFLLSPAKNVVSSYDCSPNTHRGNIQQHYTHANTNTNANTNANTNTNASTSKSQESELLRRGVGGLGENKSLLPSWLMLPSCGLVELSGAAGAGKTQICLSLCISCVLSSCQRLDLNGSVDKATRSSSSRHSHNSNSSNSNSNSNSSNGNNNSSNSNKTRSTTNNNASAHAKDILEAMYISMGEGTSPAKLAHRLNQMLSLRLQTRVKLSQQQSHCSKQEVNRLRLDYLKRIHTRQLNTRQDFEQFLMHDLEPILQRQRQEQRQRLLELKNFKHGDERQLRRLGIIVLDSLAGLYRIAEDDGGQDTTPSKEYYMHRSAMFYTIAAQLKRLSERYGVYFVVVNQVTASFDHGVIPSLGLSWSNCVSERYFVFRREDSGRGGGGGGGGLYSGANANTYDNASRRKFWRGIKLLTSATWGRQEATFRIEPAGVVLV